LRLKCLTIFKQIAIKLPMAVSAAKTSPTISGMSKCGGSDDRSMCRRGYKKARPPDRQAERDGGRGGKRVGKR